jgi:dTDP-4-dehydrorhamnose 3,5-epimerase
MNIIETGFKGLYHIKPNVFEDNRGYFFESYNRETLLKHGLSMDFKQDNQSMSSANVLRGMHFQVPPYEQGKLVRVISGSVLDVVVDLRKDQPTFGKHYKCILDAVQKNMLWIPPGFAHGFLTLEDHTVFFYKCSQVYNRESDRSLRWDDPAFGIDWGISNPIVSEKDINAPGFKDFVSPF